MPPTTAQNERVIEAVVSGPGEANRLFTVTGQAATPMTLDADSIDAQTFTFLVGPALPAGQFLSATASASFAGHVVMVDGAPTWHGMDFLSVEADWDDESGRTEIRVEIRLQTATGARLQLGLIGFSATVLAALPA